MSYKWFGLALGFLSIAVLYLVFGYRPASAIERAGARESVHELAVAPSVTNTLLMPLVTNRYVAPNPLWRFGFAGLRRPLTDYSSSDIASLRAGWYVDYGTTPDAPHPYGIEYQPTIRVKQWKLNPDASWTTWCVDCPYVEPYTYTVSPSRDEIRSIASSHPGMMWMIGNEIERRDWSGGRQDEILPDVYAVAYNELYFLIKQADPSAQVATGSLVLWSPLREEYLNKVWSEYLTRFGSTLPADVWNLHLYILPEKANDWGAGIPAGSTATAGVSYSLLDNKNFSIASNQMIQPFRTWLQRHGQQSKPLILTEIGVNMPEWVLCADYPNTSGCPFTPEQIRDSYMYPAFNYLLNYTDAAIGMPTDGNRLVQRWIWWSLDDDDGSYAQEDCSTKEKGVVFCQYYGGNLMYSGIAGSSPNAKGMAPLGTFWSQYVAGLPTAPAKPYAPTKSQVGPSTPGLDMVVPGSWSSPASCPDSRKVRLQFVEPSAEGALPGISRQEAPPRVTRETTICAPVLSR